MHFRTGSQIREDFLRFFESKAHRRVHSSSLVPHNDPTLLFTNAGMNQFKDVFLGADRRPYTRAATSQKCVRAGGKHNDLENVGFTRRHHTFFEMLGNFSFGDYFKREAIAYAWELLTSDADHCFAIDKSRLYVTIFAGDASVPRDDEAERLWIETGVPADRIFEMPAKDNFWQMGETGPCGPCSEIFYDLGLEASEHTKPDGTKQDKPFPEDDQRYVEIWNLVFMQFDRALTPTGPVLTPLPKPSIDTGMGLERIACVLQGVLSNYQTDLFTPLIQRAAELTNLTPEPPSSPLNLSSFAEGGGPASRPGAGTNAGGDHQTGAPSLATASSSVRVGSSTDASDDPNPPLPVLRRHPERSEGPLYSAEGATEFSAQEAALSDAKHHASLRIIADHARAATFLIADGIRPENEGRGYVLRKILRRAIRHGRNLGQEKPFMHHMVYAVRDEMQTAYPELTEAADRIGKTVLAEELQFARVMEAGSLKLQAAIDESASATLREITSALPSSALDQLASTRAALDHLSLIRENSLNTAAAQALSSLSSLNSSKAAAALSALNQLSGPNASAALSAVAQVKDWRAISALDQLQGPQVTSTIELLKILGAQDSTVSKMNATLSGSTAFHLYETYGLPRDYIMDAARDSGVGFDEAEFELAKEAEQARARASWRGGSQKSANPLYTELPKTEFEGYSALRLDGARVLALTKDGTGTQSLAPGDEGEVILDATSFYADSGGQQGDIGHLLGPDHHTPVAEVRGATKPVQGVFAHKVFALKPIAINDELDTVVDPANRHATERNHTGTHLLHAALRQVLGTHVKQAGSLNNATRLRFDFSHFAPVADAELQEIEDIVNREVLANAHVETLVDVPIDEAVRDLGAMALFGEKYGDRVRVVRIGDFSTELCGGTHTRATGEIGLLKLTAESSVSSGIRRIEALSGANSLQAFRRDHAVAQVATHLTGGAQDPAEALTQKLAAQEEELKKLRRELDQARMKSAAAVTAEAAPIDVKGIKLLAQRVTGLDKAQMRTLVDTLRTKLGSGVVLLGAVTEEGKVSLIAGVTKDLTTRIQAGKLISTLAPLVGGKGGGRPDLAEAGGTTPGTLDATLTQAPEILATLLT